MQVEKRDHNLIKSSLHALNRHRSRYDFKALIQSCPELEQYVSLNKYNDESIDFSNPAAVKMLNKSLLMHFYNIEYWDIPEGYLCPPIPGRADYIHHIAELLSKSNKGVVPTGNSIRCLDVGVGANCIYPIIGHQEYGWSFVGSEVEAKAIQSAQKIVTENEGLKDHVVIHPQDDKYEIFKGIVKTDKFDLVICNPPFHSSAEEAQKGSARKVRNLHKTKSKKPALNFGGKSNELWCEGGEEEFVRRIIIQSKFIPRSVFWFSTLISKQSNLKAVYNELKKAGARDVKTISMAQGNKVSRFVAWTYLPHSHQEEWVKSRWNK